jgi:hypothetical protein
MSSLIEIAGGGGQACPTSRTIALTRASVRRRDAINDRRLKSR